MNSRYHHIRSRWSDIVDLDKISKDFEDQFEVKVMTYPKDDIEMSLH